MIFVGINFCEFCESQRFNYTLLPMALSIQRVIRLCTFNFTNKYSTNINEATLSIWVLVSYILCKFFPCTLIAGVKILEVFIQICIGDLNWNARCNFLIFRIKIPTSKYKMETGCYGRDNIVHHLYCDISVYGLTILFIFFINWWYFR